MNTRTAATSSDVGGSMPRITTEVEHEDSDDERTIMEISHSQDMHGDPRIRWVYFMLGAATLLSWNGMSLRRYGLVDG
jgi:hypothetical protein